MSSQLDILEPLRADPLTAEFVDDLDRLLKRFSAFPIDPIVRGDPDDVRGLSWRCKAIAYANVLCGKELLEQTIIAVGHRNVLAATVLKRALDETLAALVFARRKLERTVASADPSQLRNVLNRLIGGNRYMEERGHQFPKPFNILPMIDEAGKYLDELVGKEKGAGKEFRDSYDFDCEFVHPMMGSFAIYQSQGEEQSLFSQDSVQHYEATVSALLSGVRAAAAVLLEQADEMTAVENLPPKWPAGDDLK